MSQDITAGLLEFIEASPSPYHVIQNIKDRLEVRGYQQLEENRPWELQADGKYFTIRGGSSLIAFRVPDPAYHGFQIIASHCDSPTFKIKEHPEIESGHSFIQLNVEKYGGTLCAPWMDRPLSVAGRILVRTGQGVEARLVNVDRDLVLIPNLAIHMNRDANQGISYNPQADMLPLFGGIDAKDRFLPLIAQAAQAEPEDILGHDLFLYNRQKGSMWGADGEYISSPRLDDLQCAFASLMGFLESRHGGSVPVLCVLDNEEVGSTTKQGAASTFLKDTLMRVNRAVGRSEDDYLMALADSFMASADNAHSLHPNHPSKADPTNQPVMNGGIVIKYNANQKYTTDAVSAALFKQVCEKAGVPYQTFANRSDIAGGSTLGNLSNAQAPMNTVDIGLAQLAMHSACETAGSSDTGYLEQAARAFYGCSLENRSQEILIHWQDFH